MLRDWQTPAAVTPPAVERSPAPNGEGCLRAVWRADALGRLAGIAAAAAPALAALPAPRLAEAWGATVEVFRDPASAVRRRLDPALAAATRLSPAGLAAGLDAVLGGVAGGHAEAVLAAGGTGRGVSPPPVLVVLAGNLPALAVQPLLPALARRRAVILKSSRAEPLFAPAFLAALAEREPVLGEACAAVAWPGGDTGLEAPLLAACDPVLAYGDEPAIADLERRAAGRVVAYGPKTSLAVVGAAADPAIVAAGLARDVALFDQRGCLSIAAVYVVGGEALALELAAALAGELGRLADLWPPGPATAGEFAAVRHVRDEALMAGARLLPLPPAAGTVLLDRRPAFRPTPGRRTVRVLPLPDAAALPALLAPWAGRLQGVATAGLPAAETSLRAALAPLGVSRFAPPGRLQHPDVRWHNGGVDPLQALA